MRLLCCMKCLTLLLFLFPSTLFSTDITLDASNTAMVVNANSLSWQHQVSGSERLLAVSLVVGSSRNITNVTYNGSPLIEVSRTFINSMTVSLWYLVAPPTGIGTVAVGINGPGDILGGSHSYNGVDQLTPFRNILSQNGNSIDGGGTIISSPDDLVIDVAGFINEDASAGPGQKEIFLLEGSLNMGSSLEPGAVAVQMSWLHGTDQWGIVVASLQSTAPLPVELLSFRATAEHFKVRLDWVTASESDNAFFQVEKSADGLQWHPLREIQGAGNSNTYRTYSIYDEEAFAGVSYYRLRQVDFDGQFEILGPVSVELKVLEEPMELFPNPIRQGEALSVLYRHRSAESDIELRIVDLMGRRVFTQHFGPFTSGASPLLSVPLNGIQEEGFYFVQLFDSHNLRMVQQKLFIGARD